MFHKKPCCASRRRYQSMGGGGGAGVRGVHQHWFDKRRSHKLLRRMLRDELRRMIERGDEDGTTLSF